MYTYIFVCLCVFACVFPQRRNKNNLSPIGSFLSSSRHRSIVSNFLGNYSAKT